MQINRRQIRIKAMQILYAYEITKDPIKNIKKNILSEIDDKESLDFANDLIDNVIKNMDYLDKLIKDKILNWEYERIALLDKILIRMGLSELLYFPEIPPKVSINEAIEISKEYCTSKSGKFINGILDAFFLELKEKKLLVKTGRGLLELKKKSNEK